MQIPETTLCSLNGHVLKPETPKHRNETSETKPTKIPKPPKRNQLKYPNHRNETN